MSNVTTLNRVPSPAAGGRLESDLLRKQRERAKVARYIAICANAAATVIGAALAVGAVGYLVAALAH